MNWVFFIGWALVAAYFLLLAWYSYWWIKIKESATQFEPTDLPKISVIIAARNEEETLPRCLQCITNQKYPPDRVEVIVIDDHSEDETALVAANFPNTSVLSLSNYTDTKMMGFKKKAISMGIEHATGEIIVSTDADCIMGKNWLLSISNSFVSNPDAQIIAAPVCLFPEAGTASILYAFQQLDFLIYQGITGGGIRSRLHHLCNGANLAYRKKPFFMVNGFSGNEHLPSGDDVFLIQKISHQFPLGAMYLKSKVGIVFTKAERTIRGFIQQRIRWAGKSAGYSEISILPIMFLVFLLNLFILISFLGLLVSPIKTSSGNFAYLQLAGILLLKIISETLLLIPVLRFFKKERLWFWFPVLQPLHIVYTVSSAFLALWGSYKWKGRQFKKRDIKK